MTPNFFGPTSDRTSDGKTDTAFVSDIWLANQLHVARSTIRVQRHLRQSGQPHWLKLDPVYIGSIPRYRTQDAMAWLRSL